MLRLDETRLFYVCMFVCMYAALFTYSSNNFLLYDPHKPTIHYHTCCTKNCSNSCVSVLGVAFAFDILSYRRLYDDGGDVMEMGVEGGSFED